MRIELIDKVTAPANKIMGTMNKLTTGVEVGYANIVKGAVGMWGVATSITGLTADYRDFHHALAEVSTLGVAGDGLKKLEKTAMSFSIKYGENAADFVRSSYDIQSAIAGLTGNELAKFTEASNILAKGSKSDANTITNYMGTMYGIFQQSADAMGKSKWVEQLTGQTSLAVEIFKSDGTQMSAAFTSLGADAQAHGIAINEQMAVLGKLQATMSGSEAGTKYKAFLRGVGAAQEELGMKFTDSAGRMLPVDVILGKLQTRFGAIDTVAESDLLKKAFGSDEAVASIKLLLNDTKGLTSAIQAIGDVKGMEHATWMAQQLVDPMTRLNSVGVAVKISFGKLLTQAMYPMVNAAIDNLSVLNKWIDKYPHLFGLLAKLAVWIGIVVAGVSAFAIIKGAATIAMIGFTTALTILKTPLYVVRAGIWLWNAALATSRVLLLTTAIRFPALITGLIAMKAGFVSGAASAWAFSAALLANPITWVVVGVVALVAALAYAVTHWDSVKAAAGGAISWMFEKWQAFRAIIEDNPILKFIFAPLLGAADFVALLIKAFEKIPEWFTSFKNWLANLNLFDVLMAPARLVLETLNLLPGVNIDTSKLTTPVPSPAMQADALQNKVEDERKAVAPAPVAPMANVPQGGLQQQFNTSNSRSTTHIGSMTVNSPTPVNGYTLQDQMRMAGG